MTEAAVPVTASAVERFTEQYLRSLGCTIEQREDRWEVTVPEGADTAISTGNLTLVCGDDHDEENSVKFLHPESTFFQQLLSEAGECCPSGKVVIDTKTTEVELPGWLKASDVEVNAAQFTPYYDRTAVVFLFDVSIETVSEYQSEFLRAIAVDVRSAEPLPQLEETFLRSTALDGTTITSSHAELTKDDVGPLLETARNHLVNRIQPQIDEIHQEASRAADVEVEEYRQLQQQRIEELEEKYSTLSSKLNALSQDINSGEQEERVEALKERKILKSEYDTVDAELSELRDRRDRGFPQRQQEIRERHALDVRVTPLTVTQVEYERGEIDFELSEGKVVRTVTVGYGSGIGLTEQVSCSSCNRGFTEQHSLQTIKGGLHCEECASAKND